MFWLPLLDKARKALQPPGEWILLPLSVNCLNQMLDAVSIFFQHSPMRRKEKNEIRKTWKTASVGNYIRNYHIFNLGKLPSVSIKPCLVNLGIDVRQQNYLIPCDLRTLAGHQLNHKTLKALFDTHNLKN